MDMRTQHSDLQFKDYQTGCMLDISHFFDFHQWQSVKNLLSHRKKHGRKRHGTRSTPNEHEIEDVLEFLAAKCNCIAKVENKATSKTISMNKSFGIASIKELVAKEMHKEKHHKQQSFHFPLGSKLQRTHSIHHLEPSNNFLPESKTDSKNPIILPHNLNNAVSDSVSSETSDNQNMESNQVNKDVLDHEFKKYLDVLEVFKVNEKLFLEFKGHQGVGKLDRGKTKTRLTKLASFPVDELIRSKKFRSRALENAHNEILVCPKKESLFNVTPAPKIVVSKSSRDLYTKSVSSNGFIKLKRSSSSPCSINGSNDKRKDEVVEENRFNNVNRASSLNDSVNRHAWLFEHGYHKAATFQSSKSLKLTIQDCPKHFRRALSLSNIGSPNAGMPIKHSSVNIVSDFSIDENNNCARTENTSGITGVNDDDDTDILHEITSESSENIVEFTVEESNESCDAEENLNFKANQNCHAESQNVGELKSRCLHSDERNALESPSIVDSQKIEDAPEDFKNHYIHNELNENIDDDFNYVKFVLVKSGTTNGHFSNLHPLNPSLFEELEACMFKDEGLSGQEICAIWDHHQLLFDLVNEVLLETYDKSYNYWPRALGQTCHVPLTTTGHHFLKEVWKDISRCLSTSLEQELSLDYAVGQDLAKHDCWMNRQVDTECVALEVGDIVLDDLLDEIICSW